MTFSVLSYAPIYARAGGLSLNGVPCGGLAKALGSRPGHSSVWLPPSVLVEAAWSTVIGLEA